MKANYSANLKQKSFFPKCNFKHEIRILHVNNSSANFFWLFYSSFTTE